MDEGSFVLDYLMPAGASLTDTNNVLIGVEQILHSIPEVESTASRTGLQLGLATVTEANTGDISVKLKAHRSRSIEEVIADVREKVNKQYPAAGHRFYAASSGSDRRSDQLAGPHSNQAILRKHRPLQQWAPKIADAIKTIPAVKDLKNGIEDTISGPAITFNINQGVTARAGFTPQELELDTSAIIDGEPATIPIISNNRPYTLRVRFPESTRSSLDAIQNMLLVSGTGK